MFIKGLRFSGLFSFKNSSITNINRKGKYNRFEVESYDPATMDYTLRRIGTENSTELQYSRTYNKNLANNICKQCLNTTVFLVVCMMST